MRRILVVMAIVMLVMGLTSPATAGDYYEFSTFAGLGTEYDVDSYGNTIYYGAGAAVYAVDVSIVDMSKKDEPQFLADGVTLNPNYQPRTFTNNRAISLNGAPTSLAGGSVGEMYVDANYIYTISNSSYGGQVFAFDKNTGAYSSTVVMGSSTDPVIHGWGYDTLLSYGGGKWWLGNENSQVFSCSDGINWTYEFTWPDMAGGHGDGMEYVNGFIFVSDMTSNFIAQWGMGDNPDTVAVESGWTEWNRFAYTELVGGNKYVEGMGFGALGHFWAGSGSYIYELGGGEIQDWIEPNGVPEPATMFLLGTGLVGLAALRRKRFNR